MWGKCCACRTAAATLNPRRKSVRSMDHVFPSKNLEEKSEFTLTPVQGNAIQRRFQPGCDASQTNAARYRRAAPRVSAVQRSASLNSVRSVSLVRPPLLNTGIVL